MVGVGVSVGPAGVGLAVGVSVAPPGVAVGGPPGVSVGAGVSVTRCCGSETCAGAAGGFTQRPISAYSGKIIINTLSTTSKTSHTVQGAGFLPLADCKR
jgi:hypothetical protein